MFYQISRMYVEIEVCLLAGLQQRLPCWQRSRPCRVEIEVCLLAGLQLWIGTSKGKNLIMCRNRGLPACRFATGKKEAAR